MSAQKLHVCNFPASGKQTSSLKRPLSVRVELECLSSLQHLLDRDRGLSLLCAHLRAAWALLLRCYAGTNDVCFGLEEPELSSAENEMLLSPVLWLPIDESRTLREIVEAAGDDNNVQSSAASPSSSQTYRFNTSLLIRHPSAGINGARKTASAAMSEQCNMRLLAKVLKGGLSVFLEYRNSFIPTEHAKNVASTMDKILTDIVASRDIVVAEMDPLSLRNRMQLEQWNAGPLAKVDMTIHGTFQKMAEKLPNLEAVCAWDGSLTYQELDWVTSKLAVYLLQLRVCPEVFVPLCFEKSKWNVIAMFSVLKAGGAFVPLDPSYPKERMQNLVRSTNATLVVCSPSHAGMFQDLVETVLPLDAETVEALPSVATPLGPRASPQNAAYIIPTSGSTGTPKLPLIEHGNYCTSVQGHAPGLHMTQTRPLRALQFAAHSFDASLVEILTPLMIGGTVCIPDEETRLNSVVKTICDMNVTWACLTPTVVRFVEPSMVPSLATIILMGEAMSQANLDTWTKINLVNGYGPSECAVCALTNLMTPDSDPKNIGYTSGSRAWAVDPNDYHRGVPIGVVGELLIESHTAARGYYNDEKKTSETFVVDPAWANGRKFRGYLTGDLVVQNPNGSFKFVGRKDTQVKLHGQRLELPEIEHHLNANPSVKYSLVALPKSGFCSERLVAVMSLAHEELAPSSTSTPLTLYEGPAKSIADAETTAVRTKLSEVIPSNLVPTVWVAVTSLPLLPSGKLDRKRVSQWLAEMSADEYHRMIPLTEGTLHEEPSTDSESTLRSIWARVLNLPQEHISMNQSFLSLGGDSISAMQVVGYCQKRDIRLTVREVLRSRSVPELASAIKELPAATYEVKEEIEKPFALSPIQSLWHRLLHHDRGHFNQSFYLKLRRRIPAGEFKAAVEKLVTRHSMLRARFQHDGKSGWQQRLTGDVAGSYRFSHRTVSERAQVEGYIADCQASLDSVNGPLFGAELFEFGGEQHAFVVGHHLVIDLVSWRLLLEELEEILEGGSPLPPSLSFQTWCQLQLEHARSLEPSKLLPPLPQTPKFDLSYWGIGYEENTYGNAAHANFELDSKTTAAFLNECNNALRTEPVDILLASIVHSWSQVFTDREPPPFFNEGHGREPWSVDIDVSRTVGWFTTVYPISIQSSQNLVETVRRVKDFRRRIDGNGRPYFASICLTSEGQDAFRNHWPWELTFNYLGQYQQLERKDALLQPLESMAGETREVGATADFGRETPRFGLFEISAIVFKGRLKFAFTYNRHMRHQDKISQWIGRCESILTEMTRTLSKLCPQPTLSDFPLLPLTEERFQSMLGRLSRLGISAANIEDIYPCSNMQSGLLLSQTKDSGFYAVFCAHELKTPQGQPDKEVLAEAWRKVVQRHPALRTLFLENLSSEGVYDQVVLKQAEAKIVHVECEDEQNALDILNKQRSVSYTSESSPQHRFTICITPTGKVYFSLEISHAIMDGTSMDLMYRDLRQAYFGNLRPGPLYSDYIRYLRSQPEDKSLAFWKAYLQDSEVCSFPVLNDNLFVERELRSTRLDFGNLSILDLQAFCTSHGITLSNVFHTAWALTLSCYVGTNDVSFGYLTSARNSSDIPGAEDLVGPLINTVVCRVQLPESKCLLDVLHQVQKEFMDSLSHRHTPLAEVQHIMELSGAALFNTILSYRKISLRNLDEEAGVRFVEIAPIYDPTEYPVSLNIEIADDIAMVDLEFWTDHLSDGQAANVASTFVRALENIFFHSQQKLAELDHLSGKHLEQIKRWNVMPAKFEECVHHRFEEQVEADPDAPAIRAFDGDFTYAKLDAVAENLAHHLVELGIGPEVFVPTCFDKSCYAVVAMLAVLKAGGAAVPLDANHPKAALESRIDDTQAQVVLTSAARSELFEDIVPDVIIVDPVLLEDLQMNSGRGRACRTVRPDNPAFVIFTSGSTGRPKGVVLEHGAMTTSANAHGTNLGIGPGSRVLQFASYTFDNSLEEMFTTLQRGGCVCVPSEEQRMNDLPNAIRALEANFMDLTPTVAALLNPRDVPSIKVLGLGGEALTKAIIDQWCPHVQVHGQYGPSEASINSAWKNFKNGGEPTNIGRAIGSVSWLVDPANRNRLVPIGCKGELLIEGPILARGYLNDAEKTASAFIEAPEWARTGGSPRRFYCTGDLVHYTSEGEMMYLGRADSQVKLNGQRLELGEIEHHCRLHLSDKARSAVELVNIPGQKPSKALAAFFCFEDDASGSIHDTENVEITPMTDSIRATAKDVEVALSNALPAYYVPSLYIPVRSMPMTTSGKLDRKRLRQLTQSLREQDIQTYRLAGRSGCAPSGPVEELLAKLWETVLNLSPNAVGADDSFFRKGGDSIGAMRLATLCRKNGLALTVANIFSQPKLKDMAADAAMLSEEQASEVADIPSFTILPEAARQQILDFAATECDVFPDSIEDIYPCTQLQEGLIALSSKEPGAYVAETLYRLPPNVDILRFKQAWDKVVQSEAILRTRIIYHEHHKFLQVVVRENIEWHSAPDIQHIKETDRHLPTHPGGRLSRYLIVGEGTSSPCFVWTAHHAIYDGWSLSLLLSKVEACYHQQSTNAATVPYSRFIDFLSSVDPKQSDDFWIKTLADLSAPKYPLPLSADYQVQASSQLKRKVSVARTAGTDITTPSIIRGALALLIATYSGSDDVLFGETCSGRDISLAGIEEIVGPTIATSPVRTLINRQATISEFLQTIQQQAASALPYQFAGLQNIKKLNRDTATACDFQTLLVINAGQDLEEPKGGLWDLQSAGTVGTNFFTYSLVLECTVTRDGIELDAHYDSKVVQPRLMESFLREYDFLLQQVTAPEHAQRPLAALELLNPTDHDTIAAWNSKPIAKANKCIHTVIFQSQVIHRPSAIALEAHDTPAMSYRKVDELSTRLASRLIALGVRPQSSVPICFEKSGWVPIAMLAVMKAGAAFVPLDFESPILRLREIVNDVGAKLILCSPQHQSLCQSIPCQTLCVDGSTTNGRPDRLAAVPFVQPDSPAYILFTSGSTGKPKGVVIPHSSFVSAALKWAPAMKISQESRILQFSSYTFDACTIEILAAMMMGACVCVPDQVARTNDLAGTINKFGVNWATLTPTVTRTLQPAQVPKLEALVLIGEAMSQQDLITWADRLTLMNGYGPTECSAITTVNHMTAATNCAELGRSVEARSWLVRKDNHDVLVPVGAVGELLIEGCCIGAGYLNDPEKTANAFVSNIKWADDARRFYRTGDLVRYDEDGALMFIGRKDSQTKVRGQRLEVAEVEHHIVAHPLIQNVLVAVPESGPCAKRLVGVVSFKELAGHTNVRTPLRIMPTQAASLNINVVREHLAEAVPSYMVCSLWIAVEEFPLQPSGKLNRRHVLQWLEEMDMATYVHISTAEPDIKDEGNAAEAKLQAVFAKVLNLPAEDLSLNVSFLHLGGDSISAMQAASALRSQGMGNITVQDIIRSKSIAQLASLAASYPADATETHVEVYDRPFDLTPIQKFFFRCVGEDFNHFNQSVLLRVGRHFEAQEIEKAVKLLVSIHPMLRARFKRDEAKQWHQQINETPSFRLRIHQVQSRAPELLQPIVDATQATLDITNGPVLAVDLFKVSELIQVVSLVAHHLVIDVVSWGIVLEDLQNLLNGITPPPPSLSFPTWQKQQAEQAKQEAASRVLPVAGVPVADLEYWGMSGIANVHGDIVSEQFELGAKDSMLLLGAHDAQATEPVDVFLAAVLESFRKVFSDRPTAPIFNEGHGREPFQSNQDLSRTIGWFTTLCPIHLPVPPEEPTDIISTIRWVHDLRQRTPDKGRPYFAYRMLTTEGQERFAGHWPAEITFNYLGRMQNLERKGALLQNMENASADVGCHVPRFSLFEITAVVTQGSIKLVFSYNRHMRRQPEITRWVDECRQTLMHAVDQLLQLRSEPTLSDFKLLPLTYNRMTKLTTVLPSGTTLDSIEDIYPASPMQQGILLSQMKQPGHYAYHCIMEIRSSDGRMVNAIQLADAWKVFVHRHAAFRTVFVESLSKIGLVDQIVLKEASPRILFLECGDDNVQEFLRQQAPVDYRDFSPPHRLTICTTTGGRVWCKLEISHAISDGGTIAVLLNELAHSYEGKLTRAEPAPLYSDFISHIMSNSRDADLKYWKTYLSGIEPCYFPPLNDGEPGPKELMSHELHFKDTATLKAFCQKHGVTLSNVLQLSWALMLHIYVGVSDVSFGLVASGRDIPVHRIDEAVGCFVNMLISRVTLEQETRIVDALYRLQADSVNAMAHQTCSLADVQHELQLPALFNTVFTFQRRQISRDPEKTALTYHNVESADPGEYHVTVNADVSDDAVTVDFGFWKDKICLEQGLKMVDAFECILTRVITNDDADLTVGRFDFFTPSSRETVLGWNKDLPQPVRKCIHDAIQEQARSLPRSTAAIRGWDGDFSYAEFDEVTTRLAFHLKSLGINTETFVPILFEKSSWAVVSMIAIMKSGGAYVPLDPKHPPSRLEQLIKDVGANIVLCSKQYHSRAAEVAQTAIVVAPEMIEKLPRMRFGKPSPNITPDNAAYCLFTSGTTGKPKGTVIEHQAFSTSCAAFSRLMNLDSTSRTFQFANYNFDASCAETFGVLMCGGCVCIPSEAERMDDVAGAVRRLKATWAFLTPSVMATMKPDSMPTLKTVVTGGELVPGALINRWYPHVELIEAYGPTETTVFAMAGLKSRKGILVNSDPLGLGVPSGVRLWLTHPKDHHRLMPVGAVGELIIEGPAVGREYLGEPEKTAAAFVKDLAWAKSLNSNSTFHATRMYKTGDLVRCNSDGTLRYIGRKDTQIKLNGQRIELGEIEAHVKDKLPDGVDSAVELVAPASRNTAKALAVFFAMPKDSRGGFADAVQPASSDLPAADEMLLPMDEDLFDMCKALENDLGGALPAYMIPTIYIPVSKMPWSSSGKLDRHRLRNAVQNLSKEALAPYRLSSSRNKRKPANEIEKKLHALVCSVLNLPSAVVGIDDSFIRLGGDSVAAMRLIGAAQAENIHLSVIDIFKQPKLSELAAKCSPKSLKVEKPIEPFSLLQHADLLMDELAEHCQVPKTMIQDAYPTSALQEAFITLSLKQPGAYVAQHILALSPNIDIRKLKPAWENAVREMELLRTRIVHTASGFFVQVVLSEDPIIWHEFSTLEEAKEQALTIPPQNGGRLSAYTLVHTRHGERFFVWTLHHALYDGGSISLMLRRVEDIYMRGSSDAPQIPYTKFIKYLMETDTSASLYFWKSALAGASPYHFPQEPHAAVDNTPPQGEVLNYSARLALPKNSDTTPSTTLRAAWALLVAAYTGSDDVVYGETLTGRDIDVSGISDVCGPTIATVPTRIQIPRDGTVKALLQQIASIATDRIPHQHVGIAEIKRIDAVTAAACGFQNLLAIQTGGREPSESLWNFHNNGIQASYFTYPLVIECKAGQSVVDISAYYDANVVSSWAVQRILYQMEATLDQMHVVKNVRDIKVFSKRDHELLKKWNTSEPVMVDETIPSLFLRQASLRPQAVAVSAFDGEFSYAELRDLAARLSSQLTKRGVGPEKLVPLCVSKSKWAVVGILAVLMAGGGYVPLAPEHPSSRHRQIVQDCKATIVLCSPAYKDRFSAISDVIIVSDSILRLPSLQAVVSPKLKSTNTCYVLYTSGSTGTPKGVVIEHRAIASSSAAICKALHVKQTSRVFQFGSFVFDASVMEILTTLTCGATICIPSEDERTQDIGSAINKLKATWTCLTPSVANVIESPDAVPTLETFAAGAEAMTLGTINKWSSGLQLLNAYGPTEGSIVSVANGQVSKQDPANIGHALQSARAWVVDPSDPHRLSPIGAVGELCIQGPLLARGYLNSPEKTANSFIQDPAFMKSFQETTRFQRIYRTGDLVEYAPDGSLRYIGRKDNQVKLAGQRLELGEIEHHLQADKRIRSAVVLMPKAGLCKKRLSAVLQLSTAVVPAESNQPWHTLLDNPQALHQVNEVKDNLSAALPLYMIPAVWVAVSRIPALASSKMDRKQVNSWLEQIDEATYSRIMDLDSLGEPASLAGETSRLIQDICAKVLNVPLKKVNMKKSWQGLGGDSITAMQLLARCRKEGINLALSQVLRSTSLAQLAASIRSSSGAFDHGVEKVDKPFELSPIQYFYFQSIGNEINKHFNQSFTLRLCRQVETSVLKSALDATVKSHSMLRARFSKSRAGAWVQTIPSFHQDAYRFQIHNIASVDEVPSIISRSQSSLDIMNGPVFSVDLFNNRFSDQVVFLTAHHLVVDTVSWRIILGDLEEAVKTGALASTQAPLSFQVWAERQAENARHEASPNNSRMLLPFNIASVDVSFWGMDRLPNVYGDVDRESFSMDEGSSAMLLDNDMHRLLKSELVDVFVAAILHSFSRVFIHRSTPTLFNETHGREPWDGSNLDLSRTVGWFTVMHPIAVSIDEDEDDVLQTVRKVKDTRRRIASNGRPYFAHRFLTESGKQDYASHAPMEILFNYLGKMQQLESRDSLFQPMQFDEEQEGQMSDLGAHTVRPALFEISASVVRGQVEFAFMYNRRMKNQKGIRRWVAECERTIQELAVALSSTTRAQPALSDFPLLPLESYDRLEKVLKMLPGLGISSSSDVEDIYPCAAMQEGMILSQIKDSNSYFSHSMFEVRATRGKLDVQRLAAAWQKVVDRHPALRTVFVDSVCRGGVFDQVVIKHVDGGACIKTCSDGELMKTLQSVKHSKLNGKKKPRLPHQFTIMHTTAGRVVVKLEINHAVIDGGSHSILLRDLEEAYEGRLAGDGPLYSEYIKFIRSQPAKPAIDYWKTRLSGLSPCYLPVSQSALLRQRELHSVNLEFSYWPQLIYVGEQNNITVSNIMLAAWALLLRTYTGSSDICYGYLTSGRNVPVERIQDAVGAFINMLVSRVQLVGSFRLLDIFQTVQDKFIESIPHQHCSLAQYQHDLGLSGKALFNTAVSIQNNSSRDLGEAESNITFEHIDSKDPSEFVVTVNIDTARGEEAMLFTYWADRIADEEARKLAALMSNILAHIAHRPDQTVSELDKAISAPTFSEVQPPSSKPTVAPSLNIPDPGISSLPGASDDGPDWGSLIRSIVSEVVPEILGKMMSNDRLQPDAGARTRSSSFNTQADTAQQMVGMISHKASQVIRDPSNLRDFRNAVETGSIRSRRASVASNPGNRFNMAADLMAAAGVATEGNKSIPPDFVQKKLLALWSELLDMVEDSINTDDSFFQLGGDSIIAMRLVGAAREEGLAMTVADVFRNPTFADMARVVRVAGDVIDQVMSDAASIRAASIRDTGLIGSALPTPTRRPSFQKDRPFTPNTVGDGESEKFLPSRPSFTRHTSEVRTVQTIHENHPMTQSMSLLGDPTFESVMSKVHVFKAGIKDVYYVTDFQGLAITGSLLESRWMLNYFYLDGAGQLDLRKLKQTTIRLVQAYDILRTVFVPYSDKFLQVVLRKLNPDFVFEETDLDLDEFTQELRRKDREQGPRLGEAFVHFVVVRQKKTDHHRILIRLSHAQYDGYCLPKILGALRDGYNGHVIPSAPSFCHYVRESSKAVSGAHEHWRKILRGSKMTEIVHRYGPDYKRSAGQTVTLKQTLTVASLAHVNVTMATVAKAAWAVVLARIAGHNDIVFGHVISGRNGSISEVENIVGPCLNMVPVRVRFRQSWTVLNLLSYIQDQQVANMPFESLGFREIIKHCTDWPDWTNFSSVLQHNQNIHSEDTTLNLGGVEYRVGATGSQEDFADFSILSTARGPDRIELTLTYAPNSTITSKFADNVFDMLCTTMTAFADNPHTALPPPSDLAASPTQPLSTRQTKRQEKKPATLPTETGLTRSEVMALSETLRLTWEQILRDENGAPLTPELNDNFFELGGDIMGLAQVASILDQEGLPIRVEDMIEKCTFVEQVELLAAERRKAKERETESPWGPKKGKLEEEMRKRGLGRKDSGLGVIMKLMKLGIKRTSSRGS